MFVVLKTIIATTVSELQQNICFAIKIFVLVVVVKLLIGQIVVANTIQI